MPMTSSRVEVRARAAVAVGDEASAADMLHTSSTSTALQHPGENVYLAPNVTGVMPQNLTRHLAWR
eukprot:COSAG06_NODE_2306_length_7110_cov_99.335188_2_plen_66_part_00